jgi:acyl-CoA synthetase (AMP-forming)/AMP-acid ligase II
VRLTTHGVPLESVELRIVDPGTGTPQPTGETGLVQIKGPTVMRGYLRQPPEAALRDGYLVTQDLGYLDEAGYFHFAGRTNGMIKTNGANVSREEIEASVREWRRLEDGFVVGVPHPTLGEAVVLVAVGDESSCDVTELERFLRSRIAAFKLPKRVVFASADDVPRTAASDKADYPALRSHVAEWIVAAEPDSEWASFLLAPGKPRARS